MHADGSLAGALFNPFDHDTHNYLWYAFVRTSLSGGDPYYYCVISVGRRRKGSGAAVRRSSAHGAAEAS